MEHRCACDRLVGFLIGLVGVVAYALAALALWGVVAMSTGFGLGLGFAVGAAACFVAAAVMGHRRRMRAASSVSSS